MEFLTYFFCTLIIGTYGWNDGLKNLQPHGHDEIEHKNYGYQPEASEYQLDPPAPYNVKYYITDEYGNQKWREETGDEYNNKKGSYGFKDSYGLSRNVKYTADHTGFHVYVDSNEPSFQDADPADAEFKVKDHPKSRETYRPKKEHGDAEEGQGYYNPNVKSLGHGPVKDYDVPIQKYAPHLRPPYVPYKKPSDIKVGHVDHELAVNKDYKKKEGYAKVKHFESRKPAEVAHANPHFKSHTEPALPRKLNLKHRPSPKSGYGESAKFIEVVKVPKHSFRPVHPAPTHKPSYKSDSGKSSVYVHQSRQGKTPFEYTSVW